MSIVVDRIDLVTMQRQFLLTQTTEERAKLAAYAADQRPVLVNELLLEHRELLHGHVHWRGQ